MGDSSDTVARMFGGEDAAAAEASSSSCVCSRSVVRGQNGRVFGMEFTGSSAPRGARGVWCAKSCSDAPDARRAPPEIPRLRRRVTSLRISDAVVVRSVPGSVRRRASRLAGPPTPPSRRRRVRRRRRRRRSSMLFAALTSGSARRSARSRCPSPWTHSRSAPSSPPHSASSSEPPARPSRGIGRGED